MCATETKVQTFHFWAINSVITCLQQCVQITYRYRYRYRACTIWLWPSILIWKVFLGFRYLETYFSPIYSPPPIVPPSIPACIIYVGEAPDATCYSLLVHVTLTFHFNCYIFMGARIIVKARDNMCYGGACRVCVCVCCYRSYYRFCVASQTSKTDDALDEASAWQQPFQQVYPLNRLLKALHSLDPHLLSFFFWSCSLILICLHFEAAHGRCTECWDDTTDKFITFVTNYLCHLMVGNIVIK